MIIREKETYLTATEAAKHLGIARGTFYRQYKDSLQEYTVGKRKRIHYRLAQIEELNTIELVLTQMKSNDTVESVPYSAKKDHTLHFPVTAVHDPET